MPAVDCMGQEIKAGDWVAYPQNFGANTSILFGYVHAMTKTDKPRLDLYGFYPPTADSTEKTGDWVKTNWHSPNTIHSVDRLWKLSEHQLPPGLIEHHKGQFKK